MELWMQFCFFVAISGFLYFVPPKIVQNCFKIAEKLSYFLFTFYMWLLVQPFLDSFWASKVDQVALLNPSVFCLSFWAFLLKFWIFHLSFLVFLNVPFNFWRFPLEHEQTPHFRIQIWHFIEISPVSESIFVGLK